ncbi:MAG TPA: L,D-transpeptidase [Thermoleophilaceae bacterium]
MTVALVCALAAGAGIAMDRGDEDSRAVAPAPPEAQAGAFAGGPDPRGAGDGGADRPDAAPRASGERGRAPRGTTEAAHVRRGATVRLRDRPGGRTLEVLDDRTPFGSRATFAVVRREGGWLGVLSNVLGNGDVGWIRDDPAALAVERHSVRIVVDRSDRRLHLLRRGRRALSVPVGIGRPGSETPLGEFAVTDRLGNGRWSSSYGCCIIALTGRQTRLPAGWQGGDRLAIHGTDGRAAAATSSAGCVAVDGVPLRRLMRSVPLGTRVTIRG